MKLKEFKEFVKNLVKTKRSFLFDQEIKLMWAVLMIHHWFTVNIETIVTLLSSTRKTT